MNYPLLYQGSVKNLYQGQDHLLFEYSDRYSLFDWGEMPDHLEHKGEALAVMGALFFEELNKHHVNHHYMGLANSQGEALGWEPSRYLKVKKIPVTRPPLTPAGYDYSFYQTTPQEGLVPLEVIFRFGIGKGSSLIKRSQENPELLSQWNLQSLPEGVLFDEPLVDFSTKLEKGDRYVTHVEAQELAHLSDKEFSDLTQLTVKIAKILKTIFQKMNLELWDGKIELSFTPGADRGFMLVDSIGLDELRLETGGKSLSKEFLRESYRETPWFEKLNEAKKKSLITGEDFKILCSEGPPHLKPEVKELAESLYLSFTNDLALIVIGKTIFPSAFTLKTWGKNL